jgi:hypothetical protein
VASGCLAFFQQIQEHQFEEINKGTGFELDSLKRFEDLVPSTVVDTTGDDI